MAVNYYAGWSVAELESELRRTQERISRGNLVEVSAANVRTRKEFAGGQSISTTITRIRWALYLAAIASNDADLMARWPNPYLERVRSTQANYDGCNL